MIDVTIANFEEEVIAASMTTPVLVDFWAPWCGPCKSLGPILEKVEAAYEGRFKLVKIDSDQEQQLGQAFGIRSIPTCILLVEGKPVDGFQGALTEGKVKEFLDKHLPSLDELDAELEAEAAEALLEAGDPEAAMVRLQEALAINPANDDARYDYVRLLITAGDVDTAQAALAPALLQIPRPLRFEALNQWLAAVRFALSDDQGTWNVSQFDEKIAANKRDFEARFDKARWLMAQQRWTEALDELLEILMRDKAWSDGLARKTYIAILDIMETPKPKVADGQIPPEDATIATYRRRLSSVVLS